ncbi:ROK family protein [Aquibacillus saliphilus]|uniref:ROK family protein n=1 Tax=Aquibacillus saliphilus TaxID=1909422 RepID=UPI001CF088D0
MEYSIGVDIGGTKVAIAIVDHHGVVVGQTVIPTDLSIKPEKMITIINETIAKLIKDNSITSEYVKGIGIGAPGPLNSKDGIISCPPNLSNWIDIPIVEQVQEYFSFPVILENDANAAALAEKWLGAAQENNNFAYVTISTGIGAGLFVDGKLLGGSRGNAGDIGHTVVDPSYGQCPCGQFGCLEFIASGTAIARRGSEIAGKQLSTKQVFDLYNQDHKEIKAYVEDVFRIIGVACVSLINTIDPEKIVIGGGVSKVGAPLFDAVRTYVSQYALNPGGRKTEIVPAVLDQNAGVIGAAALSFSG